MYRVDGALLFSATDLVRYAACERLTQLELRAGQGELVRPSTDDPSLDVIARRGSQHEQRFLEHLRDTAGSVVAIEWQGADQNGLSAMHAATLAALHQGAPVVYQALLRQGAWLGYADFLVRVDRPSDLGRYSYEVYDAKLSRRPKVEALLQMCAYSELLTTAQGTKPSTMHVVLGDMRVQSYRLRDYAAYYRALKQRFLSAVSSPGEERYPDPVEHCSVCHWQSTCLQQRRDDDHLSLVANMRRDQTRRLNTAGITTVSQLAASAPEQRVSGIGQSTLQRLRHQAILQLRQRDLQDVTYELLPVTEPGHGLAGLPAPSAGDLFFDMEGDPFVEDGGLEYLFGVVEIVRDAPRFIPFWAHDRVQEKRAFEQLVDLILERQAQHPDLHVYHYAAYEANALAKLAGRHATREEEVDRLLRQGVFVDLYRVVQQGVRISQESYSIKKLEPLYMEKRDDAIKDAGSSIVAYEAWIESGEQRLLDEIEEYNTVDCVSTWKLRAWLEERRGELAAILGQPILRPELPQERDEDGEGAEVGSAVAEVFEQLTRGIPESAAEQDTHQRARVLLAHLLEWHRREDKPVWWAYFDRLEATDEELIDDSEAIGGLEYEGIVGQEARSHIHRYTFDPHQEHKVLPGQQPVDPRTKKSPGTVVRIDRELGAVELKRGMKSEVAHPGALIPGGPLDNKVLRRAVLRCARFVVEAGLDAAGPYRAVASLMLRRPPTIIGHPVGEPLLRAGESAAEAARKLVHRLDHSYLAIQGPPGSGKTFTGAAMILDLVRAGKRVGITSNGHRAISNLLDAVCEQAADAGVTLRAMQRPGQGDQCSSPMVEQASKPEVVEQALHDGRVDIVAGTPWLFARERLDDTLDVLVIDEAGQLSLANAVAIAGAARNLVLLGDPQQLAQPLTGTHPPGAERSALGHLIGDAATIPRELGLLLDTTWRLHPRICTLISEIAYEDRLHSHPSCASQSLSEGEPVGGVGLRYLPVLHSGNRRASADEARAVAAVLESLVGRSWVDQRGRQRALDDSDVLVVCPYNAHVQLVSSVLPTAARVGTVDKFQGQEAPVVIYSTATSSGDDLPRDVEFLFNLNRLNVAISRARGLAVLISSPALLQTRCRTPEQMRLLNAFCRYLELCPAPDVPSPSDT